MIKDNTTPILAKEYDKKINATVPYYPDFYDQTIDVVKQYRPDVYDWLDLGCGTGILETQAIKHFSNVNFVLVDPSEQMLVQAKEKLNNAQIKFVCGDSTCIEYTDCFDVVTAIQSHHYMHEPEREKAVSRVYRALKVDGVFVCFENVVPEDEEVKQEELLRWGRYQQSQGKSEDEARAHNARCGVNYFPLTVAAHIDLLKKTGFRKVHVFWYSYMQMGILAIK